MKKLFLILCVFALASTKAQNSLSEIQISILTIGPGTSLNDAFGHNGIRVKTPTTDVVYDYGRFPFNDPNFYLNFAKGKLLYSQGYSNTYAVIDFYRSQNRTIKEQVLQLTLKEKRDMFSFLATNALPQNRDYLYDFFYDNCATKIRDVSEEITANNIVFHTPKSLKESTFRDLIHENVYWNSWGSLGIDIALGSVIDKKATAYEHMFLPEYIYQFFEIATFKNNNKKVVQKSTTLYKKKKKTESNHFLTSPLCVFSILSICILFITYKDFKKGKRSIWLDLILFFTTGIIGVFILLLWFATDHTTTAYNYNILWAFALNVFVILQVLKAQPKIWFIKYIKLLIILLCLLVFHWVFGVQAFAFALLPILIALAIRYVFLVNTFTKRN